MVAEHMAGLSRHHLGCARGAEVPPTIAGCTNSIGLTKRKECDVAPIYQLGLSTVSDIGQLFCHCRLRHEHTWASTNFPLMSWQAGTLLKNRQV